jgi:4-hydroxy-tetrahydrodipicolinate synthase
MSVTGILPVVPTPFAGGDFDLASFERMLDRSLNALDGYTLLGSTGEAPSLTTAKRMEIAAQALAATPAGKDVVVGVSHTSVDESVRLARHAQEHGARAVLCSVPYYFANSYEGVLRFLLTLDAALEIDLVLYDNPAATKTLLRPDWVVGWASELEHLGSVKLTDHDLAKVGAWHAAGLTVLAGDDPILFQFLAEGVDGAMVIAPIVLAESFRTTWDLAAQGDLKAAMTVFARELAPFVHAFGIGNEIATTKALLADLGVFASDELLSPLETVGAERRALLRHAFDLGLEAQQLRTTTAADRT